MCETCVILALSTMDIEDTQVANVPLTQESAKSEVKYTWCILFEFDVDLRKPFSIMKLKTFLGTDFPWRSISGEMTKESRIRLHEFSACPGKKFFVFAKIQYGKSKTFNFCCF